MDVLRHLASRARRDPLLFDALLALALLVPGLVLVALSSAEGSQREPDALAFILVAVGTFTLTFRRQSPVRVVWSVSLATMVFWVLDYPSDNALGLALLVGVYSVAAYVDRPRSSVHGLAIGTLVMVTVIAGVLAPSEDLPWLSVPLNAIIIAAAWVFGDSLRTRRAYLSELERRVAETAARREADVRRTVIEERARIARELHDVIAHSMSVMVVQAGAGRRVLDADPAAATKALHTIEVTGRESLVEIRRIVGVLRSDDDDVDLAPAPTLDGFRELVGRCRDAGLPVELFVMGEERPLQPGLELSAYRIVQESLTNVLRHAGRASAVVRLEYLDDLLEVEISDDGRGAGTTAREVGAVGHGIIGMRERVEAFGGSLSTSPIIGGGFRVLARIPIPA